MKSVIGYSILLLWLLSQSDDVVNCDTLKLPDLYRLEGKISWSLVDDSLKAESWDVFYFKESVDQVKKRSSVSIGPDDTDFTRYLDFNSPYGIEVNSEGSCQKRMNLVDFVDPMDDFMKEMFDRWISEREQSIIGPSAILDILLRKNGDADLFQNEKIVSLLGMELKVYEKMIKFDENIEISLKLMKFASEQSNELKSFLFIEGSCKNVAEAKTSTFKLEIDNYEVISKSHTLEMDSLEKEFNLPLAKGCSKYLSHLSTNISGKSVQFKFQTIEPSGQELMLYYDMRSGHMRLDIDKPQEYLVWDFNKGLLYANQLLFMSPNNDTKPNERICVVLDVGDDKQLPFSMRPYVELPRAYYSITHLMGASTLVPMGYDNINGFPCIVYEQLLDNPPFLFGLTKLERETETQAVQSYLVQFYVLQSPATQSIIEDELTIDYQDTPKILNFSPVRIALYRRKKAQNPQDKHDDDFELLRMYDVEDFSWDLEATEVRRADLFRAPVCTYERSNQTRLDFELFFDEVYTKDAKISRQTLAKNSQLVEDSLIDKVSSLLGFDRMHLVENKFQVFQTHSELELTLSETRPARQMKFYATGKRPRDYENITYTAYNERSCLMNGALGDRIKSVLFCAMDDLTVTSLNNCIQILDQIPTIQPLDPPSPDAHSKPTERCFVYTFEPEEKVDELEHLIESIDLIKQQNLQLKIEKAKQEDSFDLTAFVHNFGVTYEMNTVEIDHYTYNILNSTNPLSSDGSLRARSLRTVKNLDYRSRSECENVCHLDPNCHSYSYCNTKPSDSDERQAQCIISRLDLVESAVEKQYVISNVVADISNGDKFELIDNKACKLYEHNYLGVYKQTNEFLRIEKTNQARYPREQNAESCAHASFHRELTNSSYITPMFAYCPGIKRCIIGKQLTDLRESNKNKNNTRNDDESQYTSCMLYSRRYETYFVVGTKVLKLTQDTKRQIRHPSQHLDDCSRACIQQYRSMCSSMDYCSQDNLCLINSHNSSTTSENDLEIRAGCLHYDRNFMIESNTSGAGPSHEDEAGSSSGMSLTWQYVLFGAAIIILVSLGILAGFPAGSRLYRRFTRAQDAARLMRSQAQQEASIESNSQGNDTTTNTTTTAATNNRPRSRLSLRSMFSSDQYSYQEFPSPDLEGMTELNATQLSNMSNNRNTVA